MDTFYRYFVCLLCIILRLIHRCDKSSVHLWIQLAQWWLPVSTMLLEQFLARTQPGNLTVAVGLRKTMGPTFSQVSSILEWTVLGGQLQHNSRIHSTHLMKGWLCLSSALSKAPSACETKGTTWWPLYLASCPHHLKGPDGDWGVLYYFFSNAVKF